MGHRERVHQLLIERLYSGRILNNSHRGDFVEMMVLDALGPDWRHVGLGWNLWDLQRGDGPERTRIQVKHCAALQLWGKTKRLIVQFPWRDHPPDYIRRDFPREALEEAGWFCELFVVGVHEVETNESDQTDPVQWQFMIAPSWEMKPGHSSMTLDKAASRWPLVPLSGLKSTVDAKLLERPPMRGR